MVSRDVPRLLHTVLDTPTPRSLAEFYRELLGLRYRDGDEPDPGLDPDTLAEPEWLVLTEDDGTRRLAFQLAPEMPRPEWPTGTPPQMVHLDMTVDTIEDLERQRTRALGLGAVVLADRTDDEDEPLLVFADPSGHPFCVFVA